ncbi:MULTISPECIES: polysaccharide deacetylase family protein [unclassified Rhizobium]|uniref:polysaccharide deacetylase family protein n=1 Tax=unclassified Rhizobium TaxID=2613769 RepID=UPI0007EB794A|nr:MULTISPECIES: polysaccharide deacetylase family protein [unclassified Rhizobium]ANK90477.1 polysaccharide deacetylase protein [Rhizobium sp. N6212]ANK96505.1 polysaccharide deacetylase protein [Rhizobium sp. N621]ANL08677.1 polysaccharide deacetylase protein [Rhizobium sp. N1341]ANL20725.1 polysaccharide deacetylase protein [Rhizobium sp. N113]ANM39518.1 polysaccharide deacetylase protein [Rhizobium sp. N741]
MTGQLKRLAKRAAIGAGLEASWLIAAAGLMRQARGRGVIFTLHHVRPHVAQAFEPNAHLEITPHFLDAALRRLTRDGYRFVRLDQLPALLAEPEGGRPFAAFTLDDGYINNVEHALPVFERHRAPFTVFVTKGFAEGSHSIWWETLAVLLRQAKEIRFDFGRGSERLALDGPRQQWEAFDRFVRYIHRFDEARAVATLDMLARENGIEPTDIVRDLVMGPAQLQRLARHPLAALGAHTISHRALARLSEAEARIEMEVSADYVEALTGVRPAAIAYPYGTPEAATAREAAIAGRLGFSVAVTTQPGLPAAGTNNYLPRMSLNGFYQKRRYVSALASGIPLKLMGR